MNSGVYIDANLIPAKVLKIGAFVLIDCVKELLSDPKARAEYDEWKKSPEAERFRQLAAESAESGEDVICVDEFDAEEVAEIYPYLQKEYDEGMNEGCKFFMARRCLILNEHMCVTEPRRKCPFYKPSEGVPARDFPKRGEEYFYIDEGGEVKSKRWWQGVTDLERFAAGNVFASIESLKLKIEN